MRTILFIFSLCFLVACESDADFQVSDGSGIGSSTARFTVVGNYLYVVDDVYLSTLDISTADIPVLIDKQEVGFGIETIYPYADYLFIGSSLGMYIYAISDEGVPYRESALQHFQSCDPVVANDNFAFVTLKSGGDCRLGTAFGANRLEVVDIKDVNNPILVNVFDMTHPSGLGLDGNTLFVADSYEGVKIFDVEEPVNSLQLIQEVKGDYEALDLIARNGILIVISFENLYQYDYTDLDDIKLISTIAISS